jgi:hypothetical protein
MKRLAAIAIILATATPAFAEGTYMGKLPTGEAVHYYGARTQCGDLPKTDDCWKNPMLSYTIGSKQVTAIANCKRAMFSEVWMDNRVVERNTKPRSEVIRQILKTACNSAW